MPELPEMESYRRLLGRLLDSRAITDVQVNREKSINVAPEAFRRQLVGATVRTIDRRGKMLLFRIDEERILLLHLMLGGLMVWGTEAERPQRTVQVEIAFGAERLYWVGLRLGYLHLLGAGQVEEALRKLGPEPLSADFTETALRCLLQGRRVALKALLVDQAVVAGIGNCYSDEICFAAGLQPSRSCDSLQSAEVARLYRAIGAVLNEATAAGGYMDVPLFAGDTTTGGFDARCRVYDRAGEPCVRCGAAIVRRDVGSRKSFCCTACQSGDGI
ncbi:MAG: bifunctional DNA-formamidopyrimidine glycosylase/DNA-(apurinic or apyrimidinic site) lyase [Paenibacillaceae bacterium]|nr:bifunctional DNA-formamidopyrimidine glycosylase/DNA-(apurinic or apyrimidinic site) lyase [Paenibacillaceae bacterium]